MWLGPGKGDLKAVIGKQKPISFSASKCGGRMCGMRRVDQLPWVMSKLALKTLSSQGESGSGGDGTGGAVCRLKLEDGHGTGPCGTAGCVSPGGKWGTAGGETGRSG